jgi:hypothetical protein
VEIQTDHLVSSESLQTQESITFEKDNLISNATNLNLLITTWQVDVSTISNDKNSRLLSDTAATLG